MITITHLIGHIIFPLWSFYKLKRNFKDLKFAKVREDIGFLYEGVKTDTPMRAFYNVFFLMRKILTGLVIVFMKDAPIIQLIILLLISLVNFMYLIIYKPLETKL